MVEVEKVEDLEFKWGKKKGIGGKNKNVQFYESFTYDGVEYVLYDCVYLYKKDEPEPEIGKLIKIWETRDKTKKVKVLWFFRPCEISKFIGAEEILKNELFLASGEGLGLANINPLEAIAGKCNVLCISKDKENPQPSDEELQMAEFVFRRTFDVGQLKIMDKIDEKIAEIGVKFLFNRMDIQKPGGILKVDLGKNEVCGYVIANNETTIPSKQNSIKEHKPLETNGNCIDSLTQENEDLKASLVKQKPSLVEKSTSGVGLKLSDMDKTNERHEGVSSCKTLLGSKVKSDESGDKLGKVVARRVEVEEKVNRSKDFVDLDNRPIEKAKVDSNIKVSNEKRKSSDEGHVEGEEKTEDYVELDQRQPKKVKLDSSIDKGKRSEQKLSNADGNDIKVLSPAASPVDDKSKLKHAEDSLRKDKDPSKKMKPNDKATMPSNGKLPKVSPIQSQDKVAEDPFRIGKDPSKKIKPDDKAIKLSNGKLPKASPRQSQNKGQTFDGQLLEVTQRPNADTRKWFKGLPWEDRMQTAHEQGTLVLLQNLDPAYTSAEVEDMVWHAFKELCTAKMIQQTATSSPHSGQALGIFKTREAAQMVVGKLDEGCLLLSNGRPLVGSIGTPCSQEKRTNFVGHLVIEKLRHQVAREMKEAISTSHCSQPNTIEYEMAMEWSLLQERSALTWKNLYQQHGKELSKLKAELKAKSSNEQCGFVN